MTKILYFILCYTIRYIRTNKVDKCNDDELKSNLPEVAFKTEFTLITKHLKNNAT